MTNTDDINNKLARDIFEQMNSYDVTAYTAEDWREGVSSCCLNGEDTESTLRYLTAMVDAVRTGRDF